MIIALIATAALLVLLLAGSWLVQQKRPLAHDRFSAAEAVCQWARHVESHLARSHSDLRWVARDLRVQREAAGGT